VGQKAYNGVAVLARVPFEVRQRALPGLPADDAQARYIEIVTDGVTIAGIYLPNGNSGGEAGFAYKLAWLDRLAERAEALLEADEPLVIAGDFNVCPADDDLAAGALSPSDALVRPETRARFRRLLWGGLTDAVRAVHPHGAVYTF
jgi:exodeoxyribonuclease-3